MERQIMKAIFRDLREKDIEITNKLADALSSNADPEYIQEISAKSVVISDIHTDFRNNKTIRRVFPYIEYLKQMHAVISDEFMSMSRPEDVHITFAKLEAITCIMFETKRIVSEKMDECFTYSVR